MKDTPPKRSLMHKSLKRYWVKALRSGQYKPCRGMLMNNSGQYCPLGVLAHIQGLNLKRLSVLERQTSVLPENVAGGLHPALQNMITRRFDKGKLTFEQIADIIEAEIPVRS